MSIDQGKVGEASGDEEALYQWDAITCHEPDAIIRGLITAMELDAGLAGDDIDPKVVASVIEMAGNVVELAQHFESVLLGHEMIQVRDSRIRFVDVPPHLQLQRAKIIGYVTRKSGEEEADDKDGLDDDNWWEEA